MDRAERLASLFPTYNGQGVDAILSVFRPDVTWMAPPEWMDEPVYCGHEGLRDLDALWRANFDQFRLDLEEIRAVGQRVVALLFLRGRIKGSTQEIEQRASWVVDFDEEGLIARLAAFFSWDEALEEAANVAQEGRGEPER